MKRRYMISIAVLAGVTALAGASTYAWFFRSSEFLLEFTETDIELTGWAAGEKRNVIFHVQNHSTRPIRILGESGRCSPQCCLYGRSEDAAQELAPGDNELSLLLHVRQAGEFQQQFTMWVDDQGAREIVLKVHGTAKDAPYKKKETKAP